MIPKENGNTASFAFTLFFLFALSQSHLVDSTLWPLLFCSLTGSLSVEFSQAEYWVVAIFFSRDFPTQDQTNISQIADFTIWITMEKLLWFLNTCIYLYILLIIFPFASTCPSRLFAIFILNCLYLSHKFVRVLLIKIKSVFLPRIYFINIFPFCFLLYFITPKFLILCFLIYYSCLSFLFYLTQSLPFSTPKLCNIYLALFFFWLHFYA